MAVMRDATPFEKSLDCFFDRHQNIKNQTSYAVAVSGGPDSMACAHALYMWCRAHKKHLHVITVDHGLRAEAEREAQQVADWVAAQKDEAFIHQILHWEGDKPDTRVMEQARNARYNLMAEHCHDHGIQTVFIAHHQDDQAETLLIRLAKGSGLDGLTGMSELRNHDDRLTLARPFLSCPKQVLVDYCTRHDVCFVQDPSNENTHYLRPRLRQSVEVLKEEGLTPERLSSLTRRLNRARQALEEISAKVYKDVLMQESKNDLMLNFETLKQHPEEIAFRIVKKAIEKVQDHNGYGVRMEKLENLFEEIWYNTDNFKPRTLGGLMFAMKDKNKILYMTKEVGSL